MKINYAITKTNAYTSNTLMITYKEHDKKDENIVQLMNERINEQLSRDWKKFSFYVDDYCEIAVKNKKEYITGERIAKKIAKQFKIDLEIEKTKVFDCK